MLIVCYSIHYEYFLLGVCFLWVAEAYDIREGCATMQPDKMGVLVLMDKYMHFLYLQLSHAVTVYVSVEPFVSFVCHACSLLLCPIRVLDHDVCYQD